MSDLFEIVDGKVIVTTSTGWKVECLPFGDDLMRAGSALAFPDKPEPPTYVLGAPEEGEREVRVPYNEESIQDPDTPEEDREAWAAYLPLRDAYVAEVAEIQSRQMLMRARVMAHRATRVIDRPDLDAWAKDREVFYGIPTPKDRREVEFQFFTSEVAKTESDILALMAGIMRVTGVSEEVLDQFESNFRDTMGTPGREDAPGDPAGAEAAAEAQA
jgi:hypothetical protein